jgi:hypothetical protein
MRLRMHRRHLKILVETGHYKPPPELVAQAMLRRRGVRELLTNDALPANPTDRTRSASEVPRHQAA